MARFKIISKDGSTIRYEGKPKYVGTYLRPSYLEFSEIASPTPIEWEIGDYIDYPRTGLRYRLYSIPQPTKNARKGSHGKAFTYSTVQFHAATKELEIALFKDVVFADNNIHFSTTPGVDTFEDVYGIANRIQACMDDIFPGKWEIRVADFDPATDSEIIENITTAKSFALTSGTCLDALSKIYALWQEVGWIHTFDSVSGKDIITIGYSSKRIDENTTDAYVYGKGNGLTAIKSRQANKEEFATRLYVYGSERNLPARYYNDKDILNAESVDIHNLMIPLYEWGVTDGKPDARKAYIENADAVAKYGVIPRIHYFDSEEAGADVYPSLERTTIGLVRRVLAEMGETKYSPRLEEYPDDSERVDSVKTVLGLPNDDGVLNRNGDAYDVTRDVTIPESTITKTVIPMAGNYELVSEHVLYQHRIAANFPYGEITATPSLQCIVPDANFSSVTALITLGDALDVSTLREGKSVSVQGKKNTDSGNWEIDFAEVTAKFDKTVHNGGFYVMYYVTVTATKNETSEPKTIDISFLSGSLRLNIKEILAKTFSLRLKQLGFDIDERAALGAGKTISMKSGMCQGRNFVISACKYNVTYDAWDLTLIRQQDDTLGMLFPNTSYPINEEDRFVLLDIAMPELYVRVAMERLYSEGQALLSRVSKIRNNYEPIIDAKVMQESGRTIREGMFMQINDEDVVDGKTEYILIDTLNISEGEAAIPTYTVSLKEKKKVSYKGTPSATSSSNVRPATESKEADIDLSGYATKEQVKALEFLKDLFYKTEDGESVGTRFNFFSEKEVSSNGLNAGGGSGGTGSGLISSVLRKDRFGTITSDDINTTFNAFAIDSLYKRIKSLEEAEVEVDLTGYATEAWVLAKNYITSAALSPYLKTADANSTFATLVALNALSGNVGTLEGDVSTLSSNLNTLKGRFDALDDALNDDVSGKINTWNEIVDFLDEYNGSEDLATVLSGMNADIALRLKTADFDAWKTDVYSPLATRVSTAEGNIGTHTTQISGLTSRMGSAETNISTNAKGIADNKTAIATNKNNISANATAITNLGKRVTTNEDNIAEILKWFAVDADGNLYTTYNLYSTKEISANGISVGSGSSGGGLISQVFGTTAFGTIASESNSATFNAYAIDSLYKRIVSLEGKATAVSFVPALTSGKQIGTLSIDGVSTVLYGVDAYSKTEANNTFLKLSGGEIGGYLNIKHSTQAIPLGVESTATDYVAIRFTGANGNSAYLVYSGNGDEWAVTPPNWAGSRILLHSNNIGNYKAGGLVMTDSRNQNYAPYANALTKKALTSHFERALSVGFGATDYYLSMLHISPWGDNSGGPEHQLAFRADGAIGHRYGSTSWSDWRTLLHSGNYSNYALPLSGGTISGGVGALSIKRTSSNAVSLIKYENNDGALGYLGISSDKKPIWYNQDLSDFGYLYHTGNFNPANYLPVNGGAIGVGNSNSFPLTISSTSAYTGIAFTTSGGTAYFRYLGGSNWGVTDNGWNNSYTLLHSGNYNSYALPLSGGTLTGKLTTGQRIVLNGSILELCESSGSGGIMLWNGVSSGDGVRNLMIHDGASWNKAIHSGNIGSQNAGSANMLKYIGQIGSSGFNANTDLAEGGFIRNYGSAPWWGSSVPSTFSYGVIYQLQGSPSGADLAGQIAWDIDHRGADSTRSLWWRASDDTAFANAKWHQIAFTDSNVASATKLATARTIWGQSFDGSGNVSGNITLGAASIRGYDNRNILESTANDLMIGYGYTTSSLKTTIFGNTIKLNDAVLINSSGNVGIGTTTNISSRLTIAATTTSEPTIAVDNHCKILGISNLRSNWLQREILSSGWDSSRGDVLYLRTPSSQETSPYIFMQREGLRVGVNTDTPMHTLDVNGTANVANALTVATNVQIPINGDRITFCSATGTYTKGILAMNTSNTYLEAPLATDSASGAKPAIMIGWRGCSAATGTTKPYPITITSGEIALNGTTAINGTLKNVNNIYPNSAGERYIGTSTNPFKYVYADWFGAATNSNLAFGANNGTHMVIKTSGNVLIGTTTDSGYKLDVNGDIATNQYLRIKAWSGFGSGSCDMWYNGSTTTLNMGSRLKLAYGLTIDSEGANIIGTITANSGVKVASGQALTFLDASGKEHKLTYDSTAGAFKFDGNILVLGDGQFNAIN